MSTLDPSNHQTNSLLKISQTNSLLKISQTNSLLKISQTNCPLKISVIKISVIRLTVTFGVCSYHSDELPSHAVTNSLPPL